MSTLQRIRKPGNRNLQGVWREWLGPFIKKPENFPVHTFI
jgi:hypothetical protein